MKTFPVACVCVTMLLYLTAYSQLKVTAPPPAARANDITVTPRPLGVGTFHFNVTGLEAARQVTAAHTLDAGRLSTHQRINAVATAVEAAKQVVTSATTRASLVLDGTLEAALRYAVPPGKPKFLLVTFGNLGVKDQLLNFVAHAQRAGAAHVVGGVDVGAFDLMSSRGTAAYKTPLAAEAYHMDGSNQHSSGSWKRFAGMRTGEVAKIVHAGFTVLHTDCDIVWLRDPMPYIMCDAVAAASEEWGKGGRFPCAPMLGADVAVSSDNMSPDRDASGHASYSAGGTFNTGLLVIRPTAAGLKFVDEWHRLVVNPPRFSRFAALTSDQQVFNNMMRKDREWPGISAPHGAWLMDPADRNLKLGALPLPLFINGHGYFVQSAHIRLGVRPLCVRAKDTSRRPARSLITYSR